MQAAYDKLRQEDPAAAEGILPPAMALRYFVGTF